MTTEQIIRHAITGRECIRFTYDGVVRTAEPFVLGYDQNGHLSLSVWQVTGTGQGWRSLHVSKLIGLATTGQRFSGSRPKYNPEGLGWKEILLRA